MVNMVCYSRVLTLCGTMLIGVCMLGQTPVHAQDTVIYRCTDANGALTLQNGIPCPKGSKQEVRRYSAAPVAPAPSRSAPPSPSPSTPISSASMTTPSVAPPTVNTTAIARAPPPPLYQCRTWDDRDYLGDVAEPPATCMPIETVGIDGSRARAAGSACEMRRDTCTPIAAEQLCATWQRRINEAEFRWKHNGGRNNERKAEYERLLVTHQRSTCVK